MKFQFNKYSKRAKKYFNKTRRKKIYNKFYDDVYHVDYSKCRKTKKTLGVKNRLYSNICNITIDKLSPADLNFIIEDIKKKSHTIYVL